MYVKYLIERIRTAPGKAWTDWKMWRTWPGWSYKDEFGLIPSFANFRGVGKGNDKRDPVTSPESFKWDYKTPYKHSIHYARKFHPHIPEYDKVTVYHEMPITQEDVDEHRKTDPSWDRDIENTEIKKMGYSNSPVERLNEVAENVVKALHQCSDEASLMRKNDVNRDLVQEKYFPVIDNWGGDKNVDLFDQNPTYYNVYFQNLQYLHDYDAYLRENNNYELDCYVGRTKAWQVLPDKFGKEQVDKVQASMGAPLQDQLDEWEEENTRKKMQLPMNNSNVHKFRDEPDYYEILDHDYERILYERQKNQRFEQYRNMRYNELIDLYYQNNIINH